MFDCSRQRQTRIQTHTIAPNRCGDGKWGVVWPVQIQFSGEAWPISVLLTSIEVNTRFTLSRRCCMETIKFTLFCPCKILSIYKMPLIKWPFLLCGTRCWPAVRKSVTNTQNRCTSALHFFSSSFRWIIFSKQKQKNFTQFSANSSSTWMASGVRYAFIGNVISMGVIRSGRFEHIMTPIYNTLIEYHLQPANKFINTATFGSTIPADLTPHHTKRTNLSSLFAKQKRIHSLNRKRKRLFLNDDWFRMLCAHFIRTQIWRDASRRAIERTHDGQTTVWIHHKCIQEFNYHTLFINLMAIFLRGEWSILISPTFFFFSFFYFWHRKTMNVFVQQKVKWTHEHIRRKTQFACLWLPIDKSGWDIFFFFLYTFLYWMKNQKERKTTQRIFIHSTQTPNSLKIVLLVKPKIITDDGIHHGMRLFQRYIQNTFTGPKLTFP